MKVLLVCLMLVAVASAMVIKEFKNCGSAAFGEIGSITIEPCEVEPCKLKHGTSCNITIDFTPVPEVKAITAKIFGVIGGVPLPFSEADACKNAGLTCPLAKGAEVKYKYSLPISDAYPEIQLYVKWELVDEDAGDNNGKDIVCVEIPVIVVAGGNNNYKVKEVRSGFGDW